MSQYAPHFLPEGPASACILQGHQLGYAICGALTFAEGIDQVTLGRHRVSGCSFRDLTGDVVGGTTIEEDAAAAKTLGIAVEVHTGGNVLSPYDGAARLQSGRPISLAGNLSALIGTSLESNCTPVNHRILLSAARQGVVGHPGQALVYDGMANGRTNSCGKMAQGPSWWSWSMVLAFAAALRPYGDNTTQKLGSGKWYAGIFPKTPDSPTLWGSDVPATIRSLDPSGAKTVAAFTKVSHQTPGGAFHYGAVINLTDLLAAYKRLGWKYSAPNAANVAVLLKWAATH